MSEEGKKVLYHYCSMQTFYNIIKNKSVWLSDLSKTNDSKELIWLKGIVEKNLIPRVDEEIKKKSNPTDEWNEWTVTKQLLENAYFGTLCWGFCLSEKEDDLGQWRGYGDDGAGIAIGFEYDRLKKIIQTTANTMVSGFELTFDKVIYENEEDVFKKISEEASDISNRDELYKSIDENLTYYKRKDRPDVKLSEEAKDMIIMESFAMRRGRFYKMEAFREEAEHRIVFSMPRERFGKEELEKYQWPSELKLKEFEFNKETLVSHLDIEFVKMEDVLKSIIIGPKSKLTEENVELILRWYGVYKNGMEIKKSATSYR